MKYRVLKITNNIKDYPECEKDTKEFPYLIEYLDDEMDQFVIDTDGKFCTADEFFNMHDVTEFIEVSIKHPELIKRIATHLKDLAPHIKDRLTAKLLQEALDELKSETL